MQAARGASLNSGDDDPNPQTAGDPDARTGSEIAGTGEQPRRTARFLVVAAAAYVTDQLTKALAVALLEGEPSVTVVPGVLELRLVRNPGAAFGLATDLTWLLSVAAIAVSVVVVVMARRVRDRLWAVALGLLLAGAVGNLTDRIFRQPDVLRGHVVDFLELPQWPVFNVADMALTVACVLIAFQSFRGVGTDGAKTRRSGR